MTVDEVAAKYRHNRTTEKPVDLNVEYLDEINPYGYPKPNRPLEEPIVPWRNEICTFIWSWLRYRIQHNDVSDIRIGDWVELRARQPKMLFDGLHRNDIYHMEVSHIGDSYIDFISRELIPYKRAWNNVTHTNCGHTQNMPIPWVNCSFIHHYLNGEFFDSLFGDYSDVQETIIEKKSIAEIRYHIHIPPNFHDKPKFDVRGYRTVNIGKLWLPSRKETFGGGDFQYETLNTPEKRIKKCFGKDTPSIWPTLTIVDDSYDKIIGVDVNGEMCEISVDTEVGFPICFRIG